ncbi:MAG: hypothetical protein OHK0039_01940 [Bacteroidia bacterium]
MTSALLYSLLLSWTLGVPQRPVSQWVFRSNLDGCPAALVAGLHTQLWTAYDARSGQLYRAWLGGTRLQGMAFGGAYDAQSVPDGVILIPEEPGRQVWHVRQGGQELAVRYVFGGYAIRDSQLFIRHRLVLPDGTVLPIEEQPEYVEAKRPENRIGMERRFAIGPVPEGTEVLLDLRIPTLIHAGDIKTDGKFIRKEKIKRFYDWGTTYDFDGDVLLNTDKPTTVSIVFTLNAEEEARRSGG